MIVHRDQARALIDGRKSTIRLPYRPRDPYYAQPRTKAGKPKIRSGQSLQLVRPFKPVAGDIHPIRVRVREDGKDKYLVHCHAIIVAVGSQWLGEVTFDEVRAEGHKTSDDFKSAWVRDFDRDWIKRMTPSCAPPTLEPSDYVARFEMHHASKLAWVLSVEVDRSQRPRLLGGRHANADYVESSARALGEEPEALTEADLDDHVERRAGMTLEQWRALEQAARDREAEELSLGQRLDRAIRDAHVQGRSVTREVRVIEARLRALQRGTRRAA